MKRNSRKLVVTVTVLVLLIAVLLLPAQATQAVALSTFKDIPEQKSWSFDGIQFCVERGYMNGTSGTMFSPDGNLTRGQLVTILYRMEGSPKTDYTGRFSDVPKDAYYTIPIEWAAENEIVNGIDDTHFAPNKDISREQIATILYRYCGSPDGTETLKSFPDHASVSAYAVDAVAWCVEEKLINGIAENNVAYLRPQNNATRAQIATILMRLINIVLYEVSVDAYEGLDDYMIGARIDTDIASITAPYEDSYGALENDPAVIEEVSREVYAWAQELIQADIIEGASYNEQGRSVAFFLKDGTTSLYFPQIDQCYSGDDEGFSVVSVTSLGLISDAVISGLNALDNWFSTTGAVDAAEVIVNHVPEYTEHINVPNSKTTVDNLKDMISSLADNQVRVLFWRSHGSIYTDREGVVQTAFIIDEKKTRESEEKYQDDRNVGGNVPQTLGVSGKNYAVNGYFFDEYMSAMSGGLFYSGACQSANGNLGQIVLAKGFDAYCGASNDIFTMYSDDMMTAVAEELTKIDENGIYPTIVEALNKAKATVGQKDIYGTEVKLKQVDATNPFRLADYRVAYAQHLMNELKDYDGFARFALVHIDEDQIPELVISPAWVTMAVPTVYTYEKGKVAEVGSFGSMGQFDYVHQKNLIWSAYLSSGYNSNGFFMFKDTEAVCVDSFFDNQYAFANETKYFKVNDIPVSESEYRTQLEAYTKGYTWQRVEYDDCFEISQTNINLLLNETETVIVCP